MQLVGRRPSPPMHPATMPTAPTSPTPQTTPTTTTTKTLPISPGIRDHFRPDAPNRAKAAKTKNTTRQCRSLQLLALTSSTPHHDACTIGRGYPLIIPQCPIRHELRTPLLRQRGRDLTSIPTHITTMTLPTTSTPDSHHTKNTPNYVPNSQGKHTIS